MGSKESKENWSSLLRNKTLRNDSSPSVGHSKLNLLVSKRSWNWRKKSSQLHNEIRDGQLSFCLFRKQTLTDLWLRRDSDRPWSGSVFQGILGTLRTRAKRIWPNEKAAQEQRHITEVQGERSTMTSKHVTTARPSQQKWKDTKYSLPNIPGTSERIARFLRGVGVLTSIRPISTIRPMLVRNHLEKPRHGAVCDTPYVDCSWRYVTAKISLLLVMWYCFGNAVFPELLTTFISNKTKINKQA